MIQKKIISGSLEIHRIELVSSSTPTNHTVPKVPTGAKVTLPANRFFLSIACCVLAAGHI
jgi:hypothetical protein|tara:strand:+ start:426 stop:605 length:180 start_codon:yes stop_codon:yes gene_type:complete